MDARLRVYHTRHPLVTTNLLLRPLHLCPRMLHVEVDALPYFLFKTDSLKKYTSILILGSHSSLKIIVCSPLLEHAAEILHPVVML